jgi:hypothetical protein
VNFNNSELVEYTQREEALLVIDVATFHNTPRIRQELKAIRTIPAMVPGGLTSYVQVLDTHVNKLVKQFLREAGDNWLQEREDNYKAKNQPIPKLTTKDQRVKTTWLAAKAIERLKEPANQAIIRRGFQQTGVSIRPDSSEDRLIRIKGLSDNQLEALRKALRDLTLLDSIAEDDLSTIPISLEPADDLELIEDSTFQRSPLFLKTNKELSTICKELNIAISGNKTTLVRRIEAKLREDREIESL